MRLLRRIAPVIALIAAASIRADEERPDWNAIVVRFNIDRDGKLHMTEHVTVDVPPSVQRLERTYWQDAEQKVMVDAITLYAEDRTVRLEDYGDLDRAHTFRQSEWPGRVVWSVRDKADVPASTRTLTYVIESQVSDAVIPAWSIPRGKVLSHDNSGRLGDPRERLRVVIPMWREALRRNPWHRFLVDYQYDMPPPGTNGTSIRLQIDWPAGWKPVQEITPGTVASPIRRDSNNPDHYRLLHLFEEDSRRVLTGIDIPPHAIRMASLVGFPIVGLLFWLAFVLIAFLRRPHGLVDDEQAVRDAVYSQPPEKIEARWSGRAPYITVERFLRRLERERKIAVGIEKRGDEEDDLVKLRLLVPREQLTPYEGLGIQILMRDGWEATSDEIRARRNEEKFDAEGALNLAVQNTAAKAKKKQRAPWYSRLTSFALFAAGIYFALQETARLHREPAVLALTLIAASMLFNIWPDRTTREAVRSSLRNALFLLIPLAIFTAIIVAVHFAAQMPPGFFASAGMSLALLGTYKAMLANSAPRGDAQLARARNWLRRELKSPTPRLRDDAIPWLNALGLQADIARWQRRNPAAESRFHSTQWTGNPPPEPEEELEIG
jgi:hypothetical protein